MKKYISLAVFIIMAASAVSCNCGDKGSAPQPAPYGVYAEGYIGAVKPEGWIREFLDRQVSGLSGHPDVMCYPYNSCLWNGDIPRERGKHGQDWWRYEQTAYYSDGAIRLGYLLDDESLYRPIEEGIAYSTQLVDENGVFGNRWAMDMDCHTWPQAVFFRAVQAYCEKTGDKSLLPGLERHFLGIPDSLMVMQRNAINIEGMLWTYGRTGNSALLEKAERTWENGVFWLREPERLTEERLHQHGVTACEQLKLPVILYEYTGKREYLDYAVAIQKRISDENMLPDGVPSSAEYFVGRVANRSHETCDITDYSWTLGYFLMATGDARWGDDIERVVFNAGPGAHGKDFKTMQYLSSVNQFISTGHSNNNEFMHGRTWMQYRPMHQVECCIGNVHRYMPNYVARMWMSGGDDSVVAALFGPSEFSTKLSGGRTCTIREKTSYPFEDGIDFEFSFSGCGAQRMEFSFRIPRWASSLGVTLNGDPVEYEVTEGGFAVIDRRFRSGDVVSVLFDAPINVQEYAGQGSYVERGPLLYTYAIPEICTEDTETYPYIHKNVENPDFKSWNRVPAAKWNYALKGVHAEDLSLVRGDSEAYPLDSPALSIRVPVVEVEGWTLDEGVFTPENPASPVAVKGAATEYIDLVPYGSTCLRLTVFPTID